jgi:hypothetical protein
MHGGCIVPNAEANGGMQSRSARSKPPLLSAKRMGRGWGWDESPCYNPYAPRMSGR